MSVSLIKLIEDAAKNIAHLGFAIRKESLSDVPQVRICIDDVMHIESELDKLGDGEQIVCAKNRMNLFKLVEGIRSAYENTDLVTLADILEYELLHELEKILNKLKADYNV